MKDQHHSSKELNELENLHCYDIDIDNRIIYIQNEFSDVEEAGVDYRMASKFIKNLNYLNSVSNDKIEINMLSCGGSWDYGMAIFDAIKNSKSNTVFNSWGYSTSMSSVIPQAATTRFISKNCGFMVHYGSYYDSGNFIPVMNTMDFYKRISSTMIDIYTDRCINGQFAKEKKMGRKKLYEFIKEKMDLKVDWWLTADEAVYYGFMDGIIK